MGPYDSCTAVTLESVIKARPTYTRDEIAKKIANGDLLVIYVSKIYRLNNWIKHHPGGQMPILHMVGKDATDEINAYHSAETIKKKMPLFYYGDVAKEDEQFQALLAPVHLPKNELATIESLKPKPQSSIIPHEQQQIIDAYRRLDVKLRFLGLHQCNYYDYGRECIRYFLLALASFLLLYLGTRSWHYYLSAVFLGAFWHQLTFTAHDAGHLGITHNYNIDSAIGIFIANFLGGISIGWWKYHHNIHHLVTNHPEHDPDIQHLPFFAVSRRFLSSLYSTYHKRVMKYDVISSYVIQIQHFTYYLIMCFARFNLLIQSYIYFYKNPRTPFRKYEIFCLCLYYCWYGYLLSTLPTMKIRLIYLLISHVVTAPLHVQITLSHFGMSTEDYGPQESFPSKMLRTTMDVACPTWMDFFHGGLQFQAIHHLFPRMPRHQLRRAIPYVQEFCDEVGLKYHVYGFVEGNGKVLSVLKDVAMHVKLMKKVAEAHTEEKIH
ncbi:unnamed protein product [Didymodactylos carnosus]|uniref:Cytochrome b5 heme-binding domain-containing protein n=1 Tax=Didymodactylos carnosus TaxID=1234261 RepID=A0A8S2CY18_9BILA|nr:unnamed protein product [Didymodactylos carnosus]CAF3616407.1 unnamed protein product [Didymodactylos carnosus]